MAWLKRPIWHEDGVSYHLEKYREVPDGSVKVAMVQTPEDFMDTFCPRKDWREVLHRRRESNTV